MAKPLPDATALQRRLAPSETPGINAGQLRFGQIDYSAAASGGRALGDGMARLGQGLALYAKQQDEVDDFETKKKLIDFKLQTELAYEDFRRNMPPGADGYSDAWQKEYMRRAKEFVGQDDRNIRESQRGKVGLHLKSFESQMHERAAREEWAERDRNEIEGLNSTLGAVTSRVEADPSRRDEMRTEGEKLILSSRLTEAAKDRRRKEFAKEVDKTAVISRIMRAQTAEDFDALKQELAPDAPDKRMSSVLAQGGKTGKPAGWAATNPTWQRLSSFEKAAAMALMEADGEDTDSARNALGAMINRASKTGEELGAHVSQRIYQPTIEPAQEARLERLLANPKFLELTQWAQRRAAGQEADPVNGATHFLAHEGTMRALEAREPSKYKSWRQWTGYDGKSYRGVITRDKSHAFLAPEGAAETQAIGDEGAYGGPYATLTLPERRAYWSQVETQRKKLVGEVEKVVREQMTVAADGYAPPDQMLVELDKRVNSLKDPMLSAVYATMLQKVDLTQRMQRARPEELEELARRERDYAAANGATKEQDEAIKHIEKVAASVKKAVNEDPLAWAQRSQIPVTVGDPRFARDNPRGAQEVGVEPITLDRLDFNSPEIDVTLNRRAEQARRVGGYYNQPPQFFTKNERDALSDVLRNGGQPMLFVLGKLSSAFGNDMPLAMKEISKNAPEVATIGAMVSAGADPKIMEDAAKGLKLRQDLGEKFKSTIDKMQAEPSRQELAPVLRYTPGAVDPILRTADAIYEYRARYLGLDKFDEKTYTQVLREVVGERTGPDGTKYGGIAKQNASWFDFTRAHSVMIPPQVRQDKWDAVIGLLRDDDLKVVGTPLHGDGKEMTAREVRQSKWLSAGFGRYVLQTGEDANGEPELAVTKQNQPFVLDVRPLLDDWKKRQPELFAP